MKENNAPHVTSRRDFLRYTACAHVGTLSMLSTMLNLRQVNAAAGDNGDLPNDYKALVCVFLYGGNDAANMLIPTATTPYNHYAAGRGPITLPRSSLTSLNAANDDGNALALHPSMGGMRSIFQQGDAALVANVGTLLAPATLSDYQNRTAAVPPNLFSHNDQQVLWQTSISNESSAFQPNGWGGRMADLLHSAHNDTSLSMLVSLSGTNYFQVADTLLPVRLPGGGLPAYRLGQDTSDAGVTRYAAFRRILDKKYANMMEDAFSDVSNRAIQDIDTVNAAIAETADYTDVIPDSGLGRQLRIVAKLIEARASLGMRRQVFFCATGGFDTHGPQLDTHAGLLGNLSSALSGFNTAMGNLQVQDSVTTFTASDFGRTFDSNGRGSDHGWGSHHIVMGGCVRGNNIYGQYPDLDLTNGNPLDTGRGRWIPTTAVDQYGATLAKWFGVDDNGLNSVFPNLQNFATKDLGFMA